MNKSILVVGGGISGLTAAAYLAKNGNHVTLLEKNQTLGGLVSSFKHGGFVFDGGIRAIENSGTVFPMLRQLGIDINFIKDRVSIQIENNRADLNAKGGLDSYKKMLQNLFPSERDNIKEIAAVIKKISGYTDILYGIDNPLFLDYQKDKKYMMNTILPWMVKYTLTVSKIEKLRMPVNTFLLSMTKNQSLIDMITQHFFSDTPAFFALSYFRLYTDYYYPEGGIGALISGLESFLQENDVTIITGSEASKIDVAANTVYCKDLHECCYDKLIWAADLKSFYKAADIGGSSDVDVSAYEAKKAQILQSHGSGSVFTLNILTNLGIEYYTGKCAEHTFFTPEKSGLSSLPVSVEHLMKMLEPLSAAEKKSKLRHWLWQFALKTTYEISVPVMRDHALAPDGKSALIVSTVFSFELTEFLRTNGLYEVFKSALSLSIIDVLSGSVFPGLKESVTEHFSSTPITIQNTYSNTDGAITGWSFSKKPPIEDRLKKIAKSVDTPFKDIYQCGHWTFSPSGLPTSIITAKLAADKIIKA